MNRGMLLLFVIATLITSLGASYYDRDDLWEVYEWELLEPSDFLKDNLSEPRLITLHTAYEFQESRPQYKSYEGYFTLRKVISIEDLDSIYGIKAKYLSSSCKVYIDGRLIRETGSVATSKEDFRPSYRALEFYFMPTGDTAEIIIQISNFHQRRVRINEIIIGNGFLVYRRTMLEIIKESMVLGILFVIGIYYMIFHYIQRRGKASLYLSKLSFIVAIRTMVLSERVFVRVFPEISGEIVMKLGYAPAFLLLPLFVLYINELMHSTKLKRLKTPAKLFAIASIILVLFTPLRVYDLVYTLTGAILALTAVYVVYLFVTEKSLRADKGFKPLVAGIGLIILAAVNELLRDFIELKTFEALSIAMVIFVVIQAVYLSWQFNKTYVRANNLAQENEKLNHSLEARIKERTLELELLNEKLDQISKTDLLTSVPNRRYFEECYRREIKRASRGNYSIGIMMIDIDSFKFYNDYYGHIKGDKVLKEVAIAINESITKSNGYMARYGGEEFIVLIPDIDISNLREIGDRILDNVRGLRLEHYSSEVAEHVTVSIGCKLIEGSDLGLSLNDVADMADKALYKAKQAGKNRLEVH